MKRLNNNQQSGFTAVELLITLFIGAAFIATGYQLSTVIIKDGAVIRARAKANSVASDFIRQKTATTTTCSDTPVTNPNETIPSDTGIVINSITTVVSAARPCQASDNLIRVQVIVSYKVAGTTEEVQNAIYVYK